jgi:hypothetical protein
MCVLLLFVTKEREVDIIRKLHPAAKKKQQHWFTVLLLSNAFLFKRGLVTLDTDASSRLFLRGFNEGKVKKGVRLEI